MAAVDEDDLEKSDEEDDAKPDSRTQDGVPVGGEGEEKENVNDAKAAMAVVDEEDNEVDETMPDSWSTWSPGVVRGLIQGQLQRPS